MPSDDTASLSRPQCPNCDRIGVPGARFCSNCGTKMDSSAYADATGVLSAVPGDEPLQVAPQPEVQPERGAVLVVHKGPDDGARFELQGDVVTVGRSPDSDVFLDNVTVSRNHAEFLHGSEGWLMRDLGSLNGSYVNRERVDQARLNSGDEVQIGKYRFIFWAAV